MAEGNFRQEQAWEHVVRLAVWQDGPADRPMTVAQELAHAAGTARLAQLLAYKRNLDPEMGFIVGVLHDLGRIVTGVKKDHGRVGMNLVREYLLETGDFSSEEIESLVDAVGNHSFKNQVGSPLEELIKDADVLDSFFSGRPSSKPSAQVRREKVLKEIGVT